MATNRNPFEMPRVTTITLVMALVIVLIDTGRRRDSNPLSLRWQTLPLQASELNVTRDLCDVLIARLGTGASEVIAATRARARINKAGSSSSRFQKANSTGSCQKTYSHGRLGLYAPLTPMASKAVSSVFALLRRRSACSRLPAYRFDR